MHNYTDKDHRLDTTHYIYIFSMVLLLILLVKVNYFTDSRNCSIFSGELYFHSFLIAIAQKFPCIAFYYSKLYVFS